MKAKIKQREMLYKKGAGLKLAKKLHKYQEMDVDIEFLNAYLHPDNWGLELKEIWGELTPKARETLTKIITRD